MSTAFLRKFMKSGINSPILLNALKCSCFLIFYFCSFLEETELCRSLWDWFAGVSTIII